jgi:predicted AlkP superfamily phosphohydrolase/phosphomutase
MKLLIIGFDGATFDLIRPWAAEGHLPNLARLMAEGVMADLASTLPPVTSPAWPTFMTGAIPANTASSTSSSPTAKTSPWSIRHASASRLSGGACRTWVTVSACSTCR